eukprot:42906-Chlamydomonas_euryale.AAC.3
MPCCQHTALTRRLCVCVAWLKRALYNNCGLAAKNTECIASGKASVTVAVTVRVRAHAMARVRHSFAQRSACVPTWHESTHAGVPRLWLTHLGRGSAACCTDRPLPTSTKQPTSR